MRPRCTAICVLLAFAAPALTAAGQTKLTMRGGVSPPVGQVTAVDAQGVTISLSGPTPSPGGKAAVRTPGMTMVLSWDRVASVEGDFAQAAAPFLPTAEKMWRARSRLDRGDLVGAEPLFEELFPTFAGQQGASSGAVASGLLRCRLGTGAQTAAVAPWLAYLASLGEGEQPNLSAPESDPSAGPVVDPATSLAPSLPPMWVNLPSVQSLARSHWPQATAGTRAAILGALYEQAARFDVGMPTQVVTASIDHDDTVELVREIVMGRIGDEVQRPVARQALAARLKKHPAPWLEAWIRTAMGRSMLVESARETQLLGIAELSEVPARLERVDPYLTGIALAEAAVASAKLGDLVGATALRNELSDRFPGHPALEWEALKAWSAPSPAPAAPAPAPAPNAPDPSKGGPA
jgi:hypothetical protein